MKQLKIGLLAVVIAGCTVLLAMRISAALEEPVDDAAGDKDNEGISTPAAGHAPAAVPRARVMPAYSNTEAGDYVGPETCAECHKKEHDLWQQHPHSRMNALPSEDTVKGDFDNRQVEYAGGTVRFERRGKDWTMTAARDGVSRTYKVTRTVGSRLSQMYIGVLVEGPEPAGHELYTTEHKLPFGYWFATDRWLPEVYFDSDNAPDWGDGKENTGYARLLYEDAAERVVKWRENCIYCHNTYPYKHRVWLRTKHGNHQGFPRDAVAYQPTTEEREAYQALGPEELVTLGISCESCHFGGREHSDGEKPPHFLPSGPGLTVQKPKDEYATGPDRKNPYVVNAICIQCHSAVVSLYPNGAGTWNAREGMEMLLGGCSKQIKCTDCHLPHTAGPSNGGDAADNPVHNAACVKCHDRYAEDAAALAHSRHPAGTTSCLDCHMPRMTQGLAHVIRSHVISSPTDVHMLAQAAPNACNLCHLDKSVRWTTEQLNKGWNRKLRPASDWPKAYDGDVDKPAGLAWLNHAIPQVRLVAADAWSRSKLGRSALKSVLRALNDEFPVNRMFGLYAVERILGRKLGRSEYEPMAEPTARAAQVEALQQTLP